MSRQGKETSQAPCPACGGTGLLYPVETSLWPLVRVAPCDCPDCKRQEAAVAGRPAEPAPA